MHLACSRLSASVAIEKAGGRRAGSLWCGQLKKRAGDEQGLLEKEGATVEPVSIVLKTSFQYTSYWYTLWLVTFNSLHQQLVWSEETLDMASMIHRRDFEESKFTQALRMSKECAWLIWPVDRYREKFAILFEVTGLTVWWFPLLSACHFAEFVTSVICNV